MCYEPRNEEFAKVCRERDELKKLLEMARGERDVVTKRMIELEQANAELKVERDALGNALKRHPDRCEECEHEKPSCNGDCDGCSPNCPCYFCSEMGSNFVLKGGT